MPGTPIDIICYILIAVMLMRGFFRGFIQEILSIAALILGLIGARLLVSPVANLLVTRFGVTQWAPLIAFLILFLAIYLLVKIFEKGLVKILLSLRLQKLDAVLGLFLGFAEGVIVVTVLLFVLQIQPVFDLSDHIRQSWIAEKIAPLALYGHEFWQDSLRQWQESGSV